MEQSQQFNRVYWLIVASFFAAAMYLSSGFLTSYPSEFIMQQNTIVVYGSSSLQEDVDSAKQIAKFLNYKEVKNESDLFSFERNDYNLILVGGFRVNNLSSFYNRQSKVPFLKFEYKNALWNGSDFVFDRGLAKVEIFYDGGRKIIVVAGLTRDDTKRAAEFIIRSGLRRSFDGEPTLFLPKTLFIIL